MICFWFLKPTTWGRRKRTGSRSRAMSVVPVTMAAVATPRGGGATSNTPITTTTNRQRKICGLRTTTATPVPTLRLESTVITAVGAQAATHPLAMAMSNALPALHALPRTRPCATTHDPCPHLQAKGVTRAPRATTPLTTPATPQATTTASAPADSRPTTRALPAGSSSRTSRASRPPGSLAPLGPGRPEGPLGRVGSLGRHCHPMRSRVSGPSFSSSPKRRQRGRASRHLQGGPQRSNSQSSSSSSRPSQGKWALQQEQPPHLLPW